ncbi:mucin-13-like isoform X3 [Oncorhynchus keta]|uniref:mucin-13-like isoform X3 n=1 Tax=Oncorhynchus keta TaxID=8018 RepID=UPI0015FDE5BA|nr:mucin-13-like isoform X3 [Oncorhynchus keta]
MPSTSGTTTVITRTSTFVAVSTPSTPSQGLTFRDTTLVTTIKTTVAECVSETLVNVIRLEKITSKLISVSWTGINLDQQIQYKVKLESGSNSSQSETSATKAVFSDLTPGTMYTLNIEYLSCSIKKYISANIITAGKVYESFTRIPGRDFVSDYTNQSSKLYKDFVTNFTMQVENNLPEEYRDLIRDKEMVIVVTGVRRGSVIVDFDLVTALEVNLSTSDVQNSVINALKSSALGVDLNITSVKEADICQRGSYTCSKNASCIREGPSHTCECKAKFHDKNPTVPGTDCKRNITPGADPCKGLCSSLAQCVVGPGGSQQCSCYPGLIDQNPVNPGKLCIGVSQISTAPGEGWKVATIVLGVLLGLILLVGVVVLVSTAVRKATGKLTSYNLQHTEHNRQVVSNDYLQGCYSYQIKNIKILNINNI